MDKQSWDMDFTYKGPMQSRMSYHAGHHKQTVMCNMLGDQPLFYIDDTDQEDCMLDDLFDMHGIEVEGQTDFLDDLRAKLNAYEKSARLVETTQIRSAEDAFDSLFAPREKLTLGHIIEFGSQSATFAAYKTFLDMNNITIRLDDMVQTSQYDRQAGVITVNAGLSTVNAVFALAQSMRMAWHHKQGILINPLKFQPEDAVLVNRLFHADKAVVQTEIAWDMNLAGHKDIWAEFIAVNGFDLCTAYAVEAMTNFRSIKGGLAARATFEKWFISGRCKSVDRNLIQIMLGNHDGVAFESREMSSMVAAEIVAKLGTRPQGKNYLAPIMNQVMTDGLFMEVRDRSNANFLWFIAFERSFNETEQHLQEGRKSSNARSGENKKDHKNADSIVTFPQNDKVIGRKSASRSTRDAKATVFYLDQFRSIMG